MIGFGLQFDERGNRAQRRATQFGDRAPHLAVRAAPPAARRCRMNASGAPACSKRFQPKPPPALTIWPTRSSSAAAFASCA
jgi:hypothetical protein